MHNFINWFEIPAVDFDRANTFYKAILAINIEETDMFGTQMGFFPADGKNVSGAIVCGEGYTPSMEGTTLYLNGGEDLSPILGRVEEAGGKILVGKTKISPEMGYFAMFMDTEGNRLALHSIQ